MGASEIISIALLGVMLLKQLVPSVRQALSFKQRDDGRDIIDIIIIIIIIVIIVVCRVTGLC